MPSSAVQPTDRTRCNRGGTDGRRSHRRDTRPSVFCAQAQPQARHGPQRVASHSRASGHGGGGLLTPMSSSLHPLGRRGRAWATAGQGRCGGDSRNNVSRAYGSQTVAPLPGVSWGQRCTQRCCSRQAEGARLTNTYIRLASMGHLRQGRRTGTALSAGQPEKKKTELLKAGAPDSSPVMKQRAA